MPYPSLLVLDSGVGGLSIVSKIRKLCPPLQIHYLADLAEFPYGTKSEAQIIERVIKLVDHNLSIYEPCAVVIACNTASTIVLDEVRKRFTLPFIGVVPAIKPAAALTRTGAIGLLATEGTVNREYTRKLIQQFAGNNQVYLHGSSCLVAIAEGKLKNKSLLYKSIEHEVMALRNHTPVIDTVVLACTHFPLLVDELTRALPTVKNWVDSGEAIARRVNYWLSELGIELEPAEKKPANHFISTGSAPFDYCQQRVQDLLGDFEIVQMCHL